MREIDNICKDSQSDIPSQYRLLEECKSGKGLLELDRETDDQEKFDKLGFPKIDMSGFGQEAPYKATGPADYIRHRIGNIFTNDESYSDKLKRSVEGQMTAQERKQYEAEEKALTQHKRDVLDWGLKSTLNPEPYPKAPNSQMHDAIDRRVKEAEAAIGKQVRREMSPGEQRRLDEQFQEYRDAIRKANETRDPLGTGGMYRAKPEPGPAVKDYFKRVGAAAEDYLKRH
jgi:hypothetical protein